MRTRRGPSVIVFCDDDSTTNGQNIRTYAITVTTPAKLQRTGKMLLDYLFLTKHVVKNYVPTAFRIEDPHEFYELVKQHRNWMENHRNIQIKHVPDQQHFQSAKSADGSQTLEQLLASIPTIINTQFDPKRQRVNVSVTVDQYTKTIDIIDTEIRRAQFGFQLYVKKPSQSSPPSLNSNTTGQLSYASALAFHKHTIQYNINIYFKVVGKLIFATHRDE
jgi:hypothetical protein